MDNSEPERTPSEPAKGNESIDKSSGGASDQPNRNLGKLKEWTVDFAEMFGIPAGALLFVWHNRSDLLTIILSGVAVVGFVHGLCRIYELKRKRLAVIAVSVLTSIGCTVWFAVTRENATIAQWQPPELPPACSNISILFGGHEFSADLEAASHANGLTLIKFGVEPIRLPFWPFVKDNRFYIYATIGGTPNNKFHQISMTNDLDTFIPASWDRNFSPNEYEIVREDGVPVLQVIYRRANVVEINGVFNVGTNQFYLTSNSYEGCGIMELWRYAQGIVALEASFTKEGTNLTHVRTAPFVPSPPSSNGIRNLRLVPSIEPQKMKRIFKYPSRRYLGKYAE